MMASSADITGATGGINGGMPYLRANVPLTFVTITLPSYTMTYGGTVPTITSACP